MDEAREIYWNVGRGVSISVYLLFTASFLLCAWGFYRRIKVYRRYRALDRFERLPFRFARMTKEVLSQGRLLREPLSGLLHPILLWSFAVLFAGTILIVLQFYLSEPLFRLRFLQGRFYRGYSLTLDMAGVLSLLALAALMVRRFIRPAARDGRGEDIFIHLLLMTILITGFCVEGARMAATEIHTDPGLARFSPVGLAVGSLFTGLSPEGISQFHWGFWWFHLLLALLFITVIPFTRLRHIFTIPANLLFADLGPRGRIAPMDLNHEGISQFGAATCADLSWKDILDSDACVSCGRCQERCPAWQTGKPLSPMELVRRIGGAAFSGSDIRLANVVGEEAIWSCTTCLACEEVCPAGVEHMNRIIEMRRDLVLMEGRLPGNEVQAAFGELEVKGNPLGIGYAKRSEWADGLDVLTEENSCDADILYFAGCYASFDRRNREVARSFVQICHAAGIRVGILGNGERCCGEPARRLGNEYLYQLLAGRNIEMIRKSRARRIVTTCPHCFITLGRDYRDLGLEIPVEHHSTFIQGVVEDGRLELEQEGFHFTFHDSCLLGRHMGIYGQPRDLLRRAGGSLTEMARSGQDSFCCGGGGGRMLAEERSGKRINEARLRMARETGASLLVSTCPFCLTMMEDARGVGSEEELAVRDLAEVIAERINMKDEL